MTQQALIIQPLSAQQQQLVIDQTMVYIRLAEDLLELRQRPLVINFDLKGRAAGMYRVYRHVFRVRREIRYNAHLFAKYYDDNFATTIPHEVAHYVSDLLYGLKNIKPHGREWKQIMQVFGASAAVTADYDLSGIPLRTQTFHLYRCDCRDHQLSTVRHNRIKKNRSRYYCRYCKSALRYRQDSTAAA